jgi:formamidopyrimidine-DNA glycosylase
MPELPEVETICRGLRAAVKGKRIVGVKVADGRLRAPVAKDFAQTLAGRTVVDIGRRGKYILIRLDGEAVWLLHLGMSGKLIRVPERRLRHRHDHIVVHLESGYELRYNDPRRFGFSVVGQAAEIDSLPQIRVLGLEPFDARFDSDYLYRFAHRSGRRIRDLLIDQRVVAGLGNIYANEILYHAGVRPTARASRLSRAQIARIAELTPKILAEAIRWCGTSFSDYRDAEDRRGEFQNHLRVYAREGERCATCGSVIRRVSPGNRSAFYCPGCQK